MLEIKSHSHSYVVVECADVNGALAFEDLASAFYLVDENVATLYGRELARSVPADRLYKIEATEEAKSYERLAPIFCWLLDARCRRASQLVVVGGGVLQDIGCFVASVLLRGIRWTLLPTTLLAQCDSCIGSKSSLNINRFKNQLGTFYPPHEIRLTTEFLQTLNPQEIASGLGEAIKLHLTEGPESVDWLRSRLTDARPAEPPLREIVWSSLRIKRRYIEEDEFDRGVRNVLNYGHTFAHAFESATGYAIPHGIAVTMGVVCATFFSEELGLAPPGSYKELVAWLRPYFAGHLDRLRGMDLPAVLAAMRQDKKNDGDRINFILTRGPGRMEKVAVDALRVPQLLQACLRTMYS
jgi:3-dehydroquinate synthase